jgi:hypothetical protein
MFSPRVIDTAVENFRDALRLMSEDRQTNRVFHFARDANGNVWSLLIALIPDGQTPAGATPSAPLELEPAD